MVEIRTHRRSVVSATRHQLVSVTYGLDFGPKETALNASHCLKFSTKQRNVINQMLDALHATGREQYHYLDSPGEVNLKGQFMLNLKIDLS